MPSKLQLTVKLDPERSDGGGTVAKLEEKVLRSRRKGGPATTQGEKHLSIDANNKTYLKAMEQASE